VADVSCLITGSVHSAQATMQKFWDIKSGGTKVSDHGNYRPLQALGKRTLYQ